MYFNSISAAIPDPREITKPTADPGSLNQHHSNPSTRPKSLPKTKSSQPEILPHWGAYLTSPPESQTYKLSTLVYPLQSLTEIYASKNLFLQISKTILDGSMLAADQYSALMQDQVRLGQSFLLPQVGVSPSNLQPVSIRPKLTHVNDQLENEATTPTSTVIDPNNTSISASLVHIADPPSQHHHDSQPLQSNRKSLVEGFFFSDDSIVHSLLPHFTPAHILPNSSQNIPTTDSYGNILPTSRYDTSISTLPSTQQNLPDHFNSYQESGLTQQLNRDGDYPWVTPAIPISFDAYKRVSLLIAPAQNDFLNRQLGCCHRRRVPHLITALWSPCISKSIQLPTIQPSRDFYTLEHRFMDILNKYQQKIPSPLQTNSPTTTLSLLQHVITSIRNAFSSPITVPRSQTDSISIQPHSHFDSDQFQYDPATPHPQPIGNQQLEISLAPLQTFNAERVSKIAYSTQESSNHTIGLYTHDLAPNPTTIQNSVKSIERLNLSDDVQEMFGKTHKLDAIKDNMVATNAISQPNVPIFDQFAKNNLFTHNTTSITIFPFPTSVIQSIFSNPVDFFRSNQIPKITCAHFFSTCFPHRIRTPWGIIEQLNHYTHRSIKTSSPAYQRLLEYHLERVQKGLETESIPSEIIEDIHLQIAANFLPERSLFTPITWEYFQTVSQTPLLYMISPLSMVYLFQYWLSCGDSIDYFSVLQALIRWSTYHTTIRYQNHQNTCPFLNQRRVEYLEIVNYSLDQYRSLQQEYLDKALKHQHNPSSSSQPPSKDRTLLTGTVREVVHMMKPQGNDLDEPLIITSQQPSSSSAPPDSSLKIPLPPEFTLQIPPSLRLKYQSHVDFINTPNPCDFCYRFDGVQVVYKPWAQPLCHTPPPSSQQPHQHQSEHSSTILSNHNPSDQHILPPTVFDLNFFNINTYRGFKQSPQGSITCQNQPHLSTRYDLSSGKPAPQFGNFLSFSPQMLKELSAFPPSVQHIIAKNSIHKSATTSPSSLPFTSIFASNSDVTIPDQHAQSNHQHIQQSFVQLNSSKFSQPFSQPYGLHIPATLIRQELAPLLQVFPYATFTSSQLASLFQQPSIFTPFEQFFILSSRTIALSDKVDFLDSEHLGLQSSRARSQPPDHPYYPNQASRMTKVPEDAEINPHVSINPFGLLDGTYAYSRLSLTQRLRDGNHRYVCPLFDNQSAYQHYSGSLRLGMGAGFFAQASNPQYNIQQTAVYTNFISSLIYDEYVSHAQTHHPRLQSQQAQSQSTLNNKKDQQTLDFQNPFFKAFYTKYQHELRSTLQSLPAYRDGLFSLDFGDSTLETVTTASQADVQVNIPFRGKFADSRAYTVVFPRPFSTHLAPSSAVHSSALWISAEYLLNTQQFTHNMVVEQTTLYPYLTSTKLQFKPKPKPKPKLASKPSPIFHQQQSPQLSSQPLPLSTSTSYDLDDIDLSESLTTTIQPHSRSTLQSPITPTFQQPQQQQYYDSSTNHSLPIELPIIRGTMFTHSTMMANAKVNEVRSLKFNTTVERERFCPDATIWWNWLAAPVIAVLSLFATLIILGLVYEKKVEPTPYTLIPLLVFAIVIFLFPFLHCLQLNFQMAPEKGNVCLFKKCCGKPAVLCHPDPWWMESASPYEMYFQFTTFGDDDDFNRCPSVGRFFSSFGLFWLFLGVYLKLSGLVDLNLVQFFVPLYVFHGLQLVAGWHQIGSINFMEFTPTVFYMVSLGVLHGALADPTNTKYNAVAVTAPFLIPFAGAVVTFIIYICGDVICGDEDCDCGQCAWMCLFIFIFLIFAFWYAFYALLIQDLIRPGSWWAPPYWSVHTLTYLIFVIVFISIFVDGDERNDVPRVNENFSPKKTHTMDDVFTADSLLSQTYFSRCDVSPPDFSLSRYDQYRDTMTRL